MWFSRIFKINPLPFAYLSHVVKQHTHTDILPQSQARYCQTFDQQIFFKWRALITRCYFRDGIYGRIWAQEAIAQTKIQFRSKKSVHASKASRQIWIRGTANVMRIKNDDCSRIRCGLGQSGVDDGAGQENGRSWRGETWIESHTGRSPTRYNHLDPMH